MEAVLEVRTSKVVRILKGLNVSFARESLGIFMLTFVQMKETSTLTGYIDSR